MTVTNGRMTPNDWFWLSAFTAVFIVVVSMCGK